MAWGAFWFGIFVLVNSITDSYGLLDFGMRTALFRYISRYRATSDREGLNETFSSVLSVCLIMSGAILLITLLLLGPLPSLFVVGPAARSVFRLVVALSGVSFVLSFLAQFLGSYLCAHRRFDLFNLANIISNVIRAALIVLSIRLGHGLLGVAVAVFLSSACYLCVSVWFVLRTDPELSYELARVTRRRMRQLFSFSFFSYLTMVGDYLRFFVDSIVVGRVLGVALVTPFSVPARLLMMCRQLMLAVSSPLSGVMTELDATAEKERVNDYFLRATRITSLFSCFLMTLLLLNGKAMIVLWVGRDFASTYQLLLVLLAGYAVSLAQQPSGDLLIAKARHRWRGWWTLAEGLANLGLSIYWGRRYGLIGVALGTAAPMVVVSVLLQPWYTLRVAEISPRRYLREALARPFAVAVVVIGVWQLVAGTFPTPGLLQLAYGVFWQTALFVVLGFAVVLKPEERKRLLSWRLAPRHEPVGCASAESSRGGGVPN